MAEFHIVLTTHFNLATILNTLLTLNFGAKFAELFLSVAKNSFNEVHVNECVD